MKNIKFLFLFVATLIASAFTACQQEWEPGQPDSELAVYFPVDVNVAAFSTVDSDETVELDETTTAVFPVYRQKIGTELTVEIRSRVVNPTVGVCYEYDINDEIKTDADGNNIVIRAGEAFEVASSVTFEEDSYVAYLEINLNERIKDGAKGLYVGDMHEIEILVKNVENQGNYGLSRKTFSVGVPESWTNLGDAQKDPELKQGTYTEDFFVWLYGMEAGNMVHVDIEESDARKGVYRIKNLFSQDNIVQLLGGIPTDMLFAAGDTYIEIDATDPEKVFFPYQSVGFGISGFVDELYIATLQEKEGTLEDDIITFPQNGLVLCDASTPLYYANQEGKMRITLPGVPVTDYSLSLAYIGSENSVDNTETNAFFEFYTGVDVDKYRVVVVEGNVADYTEIKHGSGANMEIVTELNEAIKDLVAAEVDEDGKLYIPVYETENGNEVLKDKIYKESLTYAGELSADEYLWSAAMTKASLYTIFAIPYDKDGNPVKLKDKDDKPENDKYQITRAHFYFTPANTEHKVPELASVKVTFAPLEEIVGDVVSNVYPTKDCYPSSFILGLDIKCDDGDLISKLTMYRSATDDIPAGATPAQLLASDKAEDISYIIEDIPAGEASLILQCEPATEYTVHLAVTSIYGTTQIITKTATTDPYAYDVVVGEYKFEYGDSKMYFNIEPFFSPSQYQDTFDKETNTGCGELYKMYWISDPEKNGKHGDFTILQTQVEKYELDIEEFPFIGFKMPEYNAIVCYGQISGFSGSMFAFDLGEFDGEAIDPTEEIKEGVKTTTKTTKTHAWGFRSSSTEKFNYDYESFVLYYDETGKITSIDTYFEIYERVTTKTTVTTVKVDAEGRPQGAVDIKEEKTETADPVRVKYFKKGETNVENTVYAGGGKAVAEAAAAAKASYVAPAQVSAPSQKAVSKTKVSAPAHKQYQIQMRKDLDLEAVRVK